MIGRGVWLRPGWEETKEEVMKVLLVQKFTRHLDLAQALLSTGEVELVEGNDWGDVYWGVCRGQGRNRLGHRLMEVRALLRLLAGSDW